MSASAERFTTVFRSEHRDVRDALLRLIDAFEARDRDRVASLLDRVATLTGPHFRYEEEALYPALVPIFGADYVEKLLGDHDGAIANAGRLVALAGQETLADEDVAEATGLVRAILPHVSDCDGLSIMVEILTEEDVESLFGARARALDAGLDLLTWADGARERAATALASTT